MSVLIAGGGRQARAIAHKFTEWEIPYEIVERNEERVEKLKKDGYSAIHGDILKWKMPQSVNIIVSALPAHPGEKVYHLCIEKRMELVDLSYTDFDPFTVEEKIKEAGIRVFFDTGIAPGLSNLLIGFLSKKLERVEKIRVLVGGIPVKNIPPLGYTITWSPSDLIEEYTRSARIKRDGKLLTVPPLTGIEKMYYEGVGRLEAFYTDGLRSLLHTYTDVPDMEEKTIRYPGHAQKMKFLMDMGFFDKEICNNKGVSPYMMNLCVLKERLNIDIKDLLLMIVEVGGTKNNKKSKYIATLLDRAHDEFSAMERTTGFSCAAFTRLMVEEKIEPGLYPPEKLHMFTKRVLSLLKEDGIKVILDADQKVEEVLLINEE
ncbi:NAD-binding protein [candidate division WOR-3 bacterium]|nr:NAD-binding protein [candidate division WOR-3 bacterium]